MLVKYGGLSTIAHDSHYQRHNGQLTGPLAAWRSMDPVYNTHRHSQLNGSTVCVDCIFNRQHKIIIKSSLKVSNWSNAWLQY